MVGSSGVGKTTLLKQIGNKLEIHKDSKKTVGVEFYNYEIISDGKKYTLQFWDFAADKRYEFLFKTYVKGISAAIIIFDWSRIETFHYARRYFNMIREAIKLDIPIIIVGNKIDLVDDLDWFDRSAISELFSEERGFYIECSMNNTENFKKALIELLRRIDELKLIEVMGKDINLKILLALNIFSELTLNKLAKLTSKSKATISRYTTSLKRLGLIKSYSKEEEKHPGSIKKKYYALNYDTDIHIEEFDLEKSFDMESVKDFKISNLDLQKKIYFLLIYDQFGKILNNFIDKFSGRYKFYRLLLSSLKANDPGREKFFLPVRDETFSKMISLIFGISVNLHFLNENQFTKLKSLKREFYLDLNKILEDDDGSKKNYVYIDGILPILQLMELEGSDYRKDPDAIKKLTEKIDDLIEQKKKKEE